MDNWQQLRAADLYAHRLQERFDASARAREATPQQRIATGASSTGSGWFDPIDGDFGYRTASGRRGPRDMPARSLEQARTDSIAGYRANPMARSIIDTYTSFMVGDAGVTLQCTSDQVRPFAEGFWNDPRNRIGALQPFMARDWLLMGEALYEMLVGQYSGVCRWSPIDTTRVDHVELEDGNPLWPGTVVIRDPGAPFDGGIRKTVIQLDDLTSLRTGEVFWWPGFRALLTDTRGVPFLAPVLDWLDSYDRVLSNLVDRTALARYIALDVTVQGDDTDVQAYIDARKGRQIPRSGTMEVHNEKVSIQPLTAQTGSFEDVNTNQAMLTSIAAGAGLSKHWLAEPDNANRATSLSMAEPVRRRIGGIQNDWLAQITEMVRFAVDRAVAAGRLDAYVAVETAGGIISVPAADTVTVTGPQIAAADAQLTAGVLLNLAQALDGMVAAHVLTPEAAAEAAKKGWEDYVGVPYRAELGTPDANAADVATAVADAGGSLPAPLAA